MNVLFLTTHFNTGGITSYVMTLGSGLARDGHKVWVASAGGNCVNSLEKEGVRHVAINIRTKSEIHPKVWLNFGHLRHLIRKEKIDVIHAQTRVAQVLGAALSRSTGVALITTCHGFFRPRWFRKTFPCWGTAVIAISQPVARHLKEDFKVPDERIHLIVNGIDLERFALVTPERRQIMRQKIALGDGALIGIIARLSDVKGIDVLIKSMPFILKEIPTANLLIVGQGPQEAALKKLAEDLNLKGRVHFMNVTNEAPAFLCAFDVFVMPSLMEGLGLSVIEAQACGIPVVASKIGGLVELIQDTQSGFLVDVNDPATLADRILEILNNPDQAQMMAQKARQNVEQQFSAQVMVRKTLGVYEQYSRRKY